MEPDYYSNIHAMKWDDQTIVLAAMQINLRNTILSKIRNVKMRKTENKKRKKKGPKKHAKSI